MIGDWLTTLFRAYLIPGKYSTGTNRNSCSSCGAGGGQTAAQHRRKQCDFRPWPVRLHDEHFLFLFPFAGKYQDQRGSSSCKCKLQEAWKRKVFISFLQTIRLCAAHGAPLYSLLGWNISESKRTEWLQMYVLAREGPRRRHCSI